MGRKPKPPEPEIGTFCKLCGRYMKIDSGGLTAYHYECARIAGVDHGPPFSIKRK